MTPIEGQPILTAAQMRAAEERAAPTPDAMYALIERAGAGVAEVVRRLAVGMEVLVLCGPGNNGGDGYVAARVLREQGVPVRVAALTPPRTSLARKAAERWGGEVAVYTTGSQTDDQHPVWQRGKPPSAPVLVDALFGTGGRTGYGGEPWVKAHRYLFDEASLRIAVDLPIGLSADGKHRPDWNFPGPSVTLAIGALKPAHVQASVYNFCGEVRLLDIGIDGDASPVRVLARPALRGPGPWTHKYTRGMVGVIAGTMPGAARLAAMAAARAGAGYVAVYGNATGVPDAIVQRPLTRKALSDHRLDVVVIGPGLGRDDRGRHWLEWLIRETHHHLVIDGDALRLLDPTWLMNRRHHVVLTPHAGELVALTAHLAERPDREVDPFGVMMANVADLAPGGHVLVAKGPTTVIADDACARVSPNGSPWLSTAGTGDVLAGAIAAAIASGRRLGNRSLLDDTAAGVWLHADAARRCGASFIADDLAHALTAARASL